MIKKTRNYWRLTWGRLTIQWSRKSAPSSDWRHIFAQGKGRE